MKEIIINESNDEKIIAVLEDENLVEEYEESKESKRIDGNIYCGVVKDILPGMQSAFVDIGENKKAFLHIKDILPKASNETGNKNEKFEKLNIYDYIKTNTPILVQVKKDEEDKKGAKVSKHISLTGIYSILMPNVNFVTISQKIEKKEERVRLKKVAEELLNENENNYGIIVRTAAENVPDNIIKDDINKLIELWKKILMKYKKAHENIKPMKLCEAQDTLLKVLIGIKSNEDCKIIVNTEELYQRVEKIIKCLINKKIELQLDENNMQLYDVQEKIDKIQERKIWLKCGGFITIDKTEALTAIDVNSGKFIGKKENMKNDTVYKVNSEATIEIAKQIRLRNINGIIIIDYIDMENEIDRENIIKSITNELKKDRSKTQIIGFTKLDLLEITRKKL